MMLEAARRRRRSGEDLALPVALDDVAKFAQRIRPKRADGALGQYPEKLYVPVTVRTKCEVMRVCRERGLSQAELGLVIVEAALLDEEWLGQALAAFFTKVGPRVGWVRPRVPDLLPPGRKRRSEKRNP